MNVREASELGLELVCDPFWAVANPAKARALYRSRIERRLGLIESVPVREALSKAVAKVRAKVRSKPALEFKLLPMVGWEIMISIKDLAKDPEINSYTVANWCTRRVIQCQLFGRSRYVLESEVRAKIFSMHPPPPVLDGEELVHSVALEEEMGIARRTLCAMVKQGVVRGFVRREGCHKRLWVSRRDVERETKC